MSFGHRGWHGVVELVVVREGRKILVDVTGEIEPYYPARINGSPDSWCPAEGGCAYVVKATCGEDAIELTAAEEAQAEEAMHAAMENAEP